MYTPSPQEERYSSLIEQLKARNPQEVDPLNEVSCLVATMIAKAEDNAVERHGRVILGAISGQLRDYADCSPMWLCGDPDEATLAGLLGIEVPA